MPADKRSHLESLPLARSKAGRALAGAITALMTGVAYATSAEMSEEHGAFPGMKGRSAPCAQLHQPPRRFSPRVVLGYSTSLGYGTAPIIASRKLGDVPGVAASAVALTVTAVVYAPFAIPRLGPVASASPSALLSVAALGVVCTAVALALFFALIREVGPQRALVITFVNPAVAVLLGVALLGEPFTLGLAIGLPVVLLGCVLATRRSTPRAGRRRDADAAGVAVDAPVP